MKIVFKKLIVFLFVIINYGMEGFSQTATSEKVSYKCSPCGRICDLDSFNAPGECPACKMNLVDKKSIIHQSIHPSDLPKFLQSAKNLLVIDVRTKDEFEGRGKPNYGTLKNAVNIPISEMEKGGYQHLDKNKTLLVYCAHAHRSSQVSYLLTQNGFKQVVNLVGGISEVTDSIKIKKSIPNLDTIKTEW